MTGYNSTVADRSSLTFSVEGLHAREELLFKAFVRLLDHLTHQQWTYFPAAADARADLLVVADGVEPTYSRNPGQSPQAVLRLGTTGANGNGVLSWPLKPDALEKELNRVGGQVARQRSSKDVLVMSTPDTAQGLMRLQQWPPTKLLNGTGRMRLATLLTGKAMSLDELVFRSALPLPLCKIFVDELQRANLLQLTASAPKPALASPAAIAPPKVPLKTTQPGLLDRIRIRLGIKSLAR